MREPSGASAGSGEHSVRSARFRRDREAGWNRLEQLLARLKARGRSGLTQEEALELPHLYRDVLASLSVARGYVLDARLVEYLNSLAFRGHMAIFSRSEPPGRSLWRLLSRDLPRSVRHLALPILLAALVMLLGVLVGRALVMERPDLFETLVSSDYAQGRTPFASTTDLRQSISATPLSLAQLQAFALRLIQNNILASLLAIGFGLALGVPTALIMFYNGILIGSLLAVFALHGLELEMLAWLSVHGTTELLGLVLAGGAGFGTAGHMMFPEPRRSRISSLAGIGVDVARVSLAVIVLLLTAGFLEAYARNLIDGAVERLMVGLGFLALWALYFLRVGRRPGEDRERGG